MALRTVLSDPMLRMLAGAIVLAAIFPAGGEWRAVASTVSDVAIFVLFLMNGMRIARGEIAAGLANWRFLLPLVLWVFGVMAFAGLGLARLGDNILPPVVAAGFLYLGAMPSTVQSATSYSSLAGGNVALSVLSAALLNILGVFISVPIFFALGGSGEGHIGTEAIIKIVAILVLPFAIGQAVQGYTRPFITRYKDRVVWIDRFVIALAIYIAFSGAVEQGIWSRIDALAWVALGGLVALFLMVGYFGCWMAGGALGLNIPDRIAFTFAGAQKSAATGVPLATILFPPAMAGFIVLPLLLYHLFQLVAAAPVATRLRHLHQ